MAKKAKGSVATNPKRRQTIRNATHKKGGGATILVMAQGPSVQEQTVQVFESLQSKFPLTAEAIMGKFIGFKQLNLDAMAERVEQFFKTMNISFEMPKDRKNIAALTAMLSPAMERAESELGNLAW